MVDFKLHRGTREQLFNTNGTCKITPVDGHLYFCTDTGDTYFAVAEGAQTTLKPINGIDSTKTFGHIGQDGELVGDEGVTPAAGDSILIQDVSDDFKVHKAIPISSNQNKFLRNDGTWQTPSDTKNTAGSINSNNKLYIVGATSQTANPQTYSRKTAFIGTDGCLYSDSTKVSVEGHSHNAFTNVAVESSIVSADKSQDTITLKGEGGISLSANTSDDTITIDASNKYVTAGANSHTAQYVNKIPGYAQHNTFEGVDNGFTGSLDTARNCVHMEGQHNIAVDDNQHVGGTYNLPTSGAEVIGSNITKDGQYYCINNVRIVSIQSAFETCRVAFYNSSQMQEQPKVGDKIQFLDVPFDIIGSITDISTDPVQLEGPNVPPTYDIPVYTINIASIYAITLYEHFNSAVGGTPADDVLNSGDCVKPYTNIRWTKVSKAPHRRNIRVLSWDGHETLARGLTLGQDDRYYDNHGSPDDAMLLKFPNTCGFGTTSNDATTQGYWKVWNLFSNRTLKYHPNLVPSTDGLSIGILGYPVENVVCSKLILNQQAIDYPMSGVAILSDTQGCGLYAVRFEVNDRKYQTLISIENLSQPQYQPLISICTNDSTYQTDNYYAGYSDKQFYVAVFNLSSHRYAPTPQLLYVNQIYAY